MTTGLWTRMSSALVAEDRAADDREARRQLVRLKLVPARACVADFTSFDTVDYAGAVAGGLASEATGASAVVIRIDEFR